ncbi:MAG: hypothetical protein COA91_06240 [Robiginitomaculum sp.]|nr:MAG: hypothetical protein COA91_06240 [Robiginitomaculum sp.]
MSEVRNGILATTITVRENQRALVLKNGKFETILTPGRHKLPAWNANYAVTDFDLVQPVFVSDFAKTIFKERPDLASAHLTEIRTSADEVAALYRDGKFYGIQRPDSRSVLWTDAGPWKAERFDVTGDLPNGLEVPKQILHRANAVRAVAQIKQFVVENGQLGLLFIDNELARQLKPGTYGFWNVGRSVTMKLVDMREQALDVTGQEVLTKDKVTIRINVSAKYRVTDPVKAVSEVKDFADHLYRALQFAFRKTLGVKTLDEILANKIVVDNASAKTVRAEMSDIGVSVGEIAIKDVILPGEMRDMLNMVVLAEKQAQANVVSRREETAATRALLNTARLMDENPTMLRLKELDALETIAENVDNLTIHNGTQGLMEGLVNLRGPAKAAKRK